MVPVTLSFLEIIQDILRAIFESVLMPVIKDVFNILITLIGELIINALSGVFLTIWVILLKLVDFMEDIFTIFSGMTQLKINGHISNQGILQYLFGQRGVRDAYLAIMAIAILLCLMTTFIAVLRSMADSPFENKKPISAVLQTTFKCVLTFAVLNIACVFAIQMFTQVMLQVNYYLNANNDNSSLGDILFYMMAKDKGKGDVSGFASGAKYANVDNVMKKFDYVHFPWIICLVATVFMLGILLASIIGFVQRLMMIIILYIISPLFVAYMPLDEGKSFNMWKDTFVAYLVSALSPIVTMKLFIMILPYMMDERLKIPGVSNMMYVRLIFIIAGAFAIFSSRNLFVKIINPTLGGQLDGNSGIGSMIGATVYGKAMKGISYLTK